MWADACDVGDLILDIVFDVVLGVAVHGRNGLLVQLAQIEVHEPATCNG